MHDADPVRAIMRQSVALLLLLAVAACGSTAQPGHDGGGGSSAGGSGGAAGGGGGGRGGAAGSVGGRGGGGGTGGCAPNQVWCSGCEPGTGACYVGGCPGFACPPFDAGGVGGESGSGGATGTGGIGGQGGGTGGAAACGARACTSSELCVHPSCGGTAPQCNPLPDAGQCPTGWTYRAFCNTAPTPGPGCEAPPCTPPSPYCITRPASCGTTPTCSCLPASVCQGGGACGLISQGEVLCVSA